MNSIYHPKQLEQGEFIVIEYKIWSLTLSSHPWQMVVLVPCCLCERDGFSLELAK